MNKLLGFYLQTSPDSQGRSLDAIWNLSDDELMDTHDVVQWLFPLKEPSQFNPSAPVLTERQLEAFHDNPKLRDNLRKSFIRFIKVFGLVYEEGEVRQTRHVEIWMNFNHNWLRFTRILKSLTLLGLPDEAMAFFKFLERKIGNVQSMHYWRQAVGLESHRV